MYRLHSKIWHILVLHIWYINPDIIYLYLHILHTLNNLRKNKLFKKIKAIYFSVKQVTTHIPFQYLFNGPYVGKPLFVNTIYTEVQIHIKMFSLKYALF